MKQLFEVDYSHDGRVWIHAKGVTALREGRKWRVGVPSADELATEFVFLNNPEVAKALIQEAFADFVQL